MTDLDPDLYRSMDPVWTDETVKTAARCSNKPWIECFAAHKNYFKLTNIKFAKYIFKLILNLSFKHSLNITVKNVVNALS